MENVIIKLGVWAKDKVTGFEGTVIGHVRYLTGCDQYLLAPKVDAEGKHVDSRWYDVNRIEICMEHERLNIDTEDDKGACDAAPAK